MILPPVTKIDQDDTHHLTPSKYDEDALSRIADDSDHLEIIFDIASLTDDQVKAENSLVPEISPLELVSGFEHSTIVNGAFCHANPSGSRFNGALRGAWYAGFQREVALSEVVFHKTLALSEVNLFEDEVSYTDYLSDFKGEFHDIRGNAEFSDCLDPVSYVPSQSLAVKLFNENSAGILYPSARHKGGTNIACFRPALVYNVRKGDKCRLVWNGNKKPEIIWNDFAP